VIREKLIATIALLGLVLSQSCATLPRIDEKRPNFLIIVSDDQRFDTMDYMPATRAAIFDQGVTFTNGYITTPLCCPARASVLTGMYAHNTGVHTNDDPLNKTTFMYDLHQNGYYTGLVGKYLNSWKGEIRPEFDYWVSFFKGESAYYDPYLNDNGTWSVHNGYITDILGEYVIQFLDQAAKNPRPFVLLYAPNAPHQPATPANEDLGALDNLAPYRPPSFNETDVSDKPSWIQDNAMDDQAIKQVDTFRRKQLLTLIALDRSNARIFDALKQNGQLDNTVIIYLSDNGLLWGEHRITSKNSFYEEATRVPFALRYPALVPAPYKENRLVANIDIAPTLYQLAGLPIPPGVDGLSLVNLFNGGPWRDALLIEGWPPRGYYSSAHTDRYVYSETVGDKSEFYDLQADPFELQNQIDNPAYREIIQGLQKTLRRLQKQAGNPTQGP
jgi:N-acetylglucosamine-6-sulfatase